MKSLSADTSQALQRKHYEMMRVIPPWKRLSLALELTQATRKLILANLHQEFPTATEDEIRRRFIARVLPREDVIRVYGFDPTQVRF